jgi:hypothetical protein
MTLLFKVISIFYFMNYFYIFLVCVFILLVYLYHWLSKNRIMYNKLFGNGSSNFVQGELIMIIGFFIILFLIGIYYIFIF